MKIAFVGTECSGKTTLFKLLAEELSLPHLPDPYDRAMEILNECGIAGDWNSKSPDEIWNFERAMHDAQSELEHGLTSFVADSGFLQRAVCALVYCGMNQGIRKELEALIRAAEGVTSWYDYIVYLHPRPIYEDNGHRSMNHNIRQSIDLMLRGYLDMDIFEGKIIRSVYSAAGADYVVGEISREIRSRK